MRRLGWTESSHPTISTRCRMSVSTHAPNVPQIAESDATDPGLRQVIDQANVTKSPPPAWYRTMGQNPEVAKAFAGYWDLLHRGGTVPHEIKELARIQIAQMVGRSEERRVGKEC